MDNRHNEIKSIVAFIVVALVLVTALIWGLYEFFGQ